MLQRYAKLKSLTYCKVQIVEIDNSSLKAMLKERRNHEIQFRRQFSITNSGF